MFFFVFFCILQSLTQVFFCILFFWGFQDLCMQVAILIQGGVVRRRQSDERWSKQVLDSLISFEEAVKGRQHSAGIPTCTQPTIPTIPSPPVYVPSEENVNGRKQYDI